MNETLTLRGNPPLARDTRSVLSLLEGLRHGLLEVRLPDGGSRLFGEGEPGVVLQVHDEAMFGRVLARGDIGLAEAYLDGQWDTPDLTGLLGLFAANRDALRRAVYGSWRQLLGARLRHWLNRNSRDGSRRNIMAHYDLGNDFYRLWLDPSMSYSSALYRPADDGSLPAAQDAKYRRILHRLAAGPGQSVLEIGCGWGGFAELAVAEGLQLTGLTLSPAQLEAAITPKTKMLVINSPSNPTGAVYTLDELKALGDVLKKHPNILVASDDMYEHVMLGDTKFYNILNACPELKEQVIVLNGVSKAYSMTGWRIGYAAGPQKLIKAMENIQSQSTSNPTSISQVAAQAALEGDQGCITPMLKAFNERHVYVVDRFNKMRGLKCLRAGGAFYAFVDAREAIKLLAAEGKIAGATDMALGTYLLEAQDVAVVPGSAFGAEGYFRISFATSMQNLEKALDRIEKALA